MTKASLDASPAVVFRDVVKIYNGRVTALDHVSFEIPRGATGLAAELAAARQMLTAAGMDCEVHAAASAGLPPATDALLAWAVREATTNVVRHSGARSVTVTVTVAGDEVTAEVADDGVGPSWDGARGPGEQGGSGLSGLRHWRWHASTSRTWPSWTSRCRAPAASRWRGCSRPPASPARS